MCCGVSAKQDDKQQIREKDWTPGCIYTTINSTLFLFRLMCDRVCLQSCVFVCVCVCVCTVFIAFCQVSSLGLKH